MMWFFIFHISQFQLPTYNYLLTTNQGFEQTLI